MPQIIAEVSGTNRKTNKISLGVSGVNRECKEAWAGVDGINRKIFQTGIELTDFVSIKPEIMKLGTIKNPYDMKLRFAGDKFFCFPVDTNYAGVRGAYYFSNDGITWEKMSMDGSTFPCITDIAYYNGTYVAVGGVSSRIVAKSLNGISEWSLVTIPGNTSYVPYYVVNINGVWLILDKNERFTYSSNLNTWSTWDLPDTYTYKYKPVVNGNMAMHISTFHGGDYVNPLGVSKFTESGGKITRSLSNISISFGSKAGSFSLAYGNEKWVSKIGYGGDIMTSLMSPDGITWIENEIPAHFIGSGYSSQLAFGNGIFVTCPCNVSGNSGIQLGMAYSDDGVIWTTKSGPVTNDVFGSNENWVFGNGRFVSASTYSYIIGSSTQYAINIHYTK